MSQQPQVIVSPVVQRNLDSAQYPQARGSQYEGQAESAAYTYEMEQFAWDNEPTPCSLCIASTGPMPADHDC